MKFRVLFISLILTYLGFGQSFEFVYKQLNMDEGLSQSTVLGIHQDHNGFIWMGTFDGLNKYDGKTVKNYLAQNNNPYTISNNSVYDICQDYKNNIYFSTDGGGVNIYNPVSEQFTVLNSESPDNAILNNHTTRLCAMSDSSIWISMRNGIAVYNTVTGRVKNYSINTGKPLGLPEFEPTRVIEDKSKMVWIGSRGGGLIKYLPEKDGFRVFYNNEDPYEGYDYNTIVALSEVNDSILLLGSIMGAFTFNKNTALFSRFHNIKDAVVATLVDSEGTIWVGTANEGLYYKKRNQGVRQLLNNPYNLKSIPENSIKYLFEDNNKNIWIGFMGQGVAWFSLNQKAFYHLYKIPGENTIVNNNVFTIEEDHENKVWIGTTNGLSIWDRKNNSFQNITAKTKNSITSESIWEIFYDKENTIWLGGLSGLDVYDIKTRRFRNYNFIYNDSTSLPSDAIFAIAKDKNKDIWIGTFSGIARYNKSNDNFTRYVSNDMKRYLSDNLVWDILSDSKGRLWVATLNGLNQYNFETQSFHEIPLGQCSKTGGNCELTQLSEDSEGNLWISSREGLIKYNPDSGDTIQVTMQQGLPSNTILGVIEHKNDLWVASKGLSKLDKKTLVPVNYGVDDGIQSNEFNVAAKKLHDGLFMFGGINGLNAFYPDSIKSNTFTPKIRFTNLELNGMGIKPNEEHYGIVAIDRSVTYAQSINLSYKEKLINIEFVALDMSASEKLNYAYRMLPNSKEWVPLGSKNSVSFTNLLPGKYILEVKSTNNEQVFCDNQVALEIIIIPPFWKRTWFYALEVLFLLVLIFLYSYLRNYRIKEANRKLEKTVQERTEQIISQKEEIEAQRNMAHEQRDKIAEQKEQLEKFNEALEEKVQKRTLQLHKAKEKAEESDRLKSAFLANMSHEIRTPLNAIIGFSNILLTSDIDEEEKQQFLTLINSSGNTLLSLLNDIIDISMIESGQLKVKSGPVNVQSLVNTIYLTFKNNLLKENNKVALVLKPDAHSNANIVTDNLRLVQILNNLISNAIKFTEEGTITIQYTIEQEKVHFAIIDTGIGLGEEDMEKIFNRFYKAENYKLKAYRGGGLGLAICKNLCEALGGDIWVKSELGKGSEFHFTIRTAL
jgi:signal transduction histidine kinase/ligand-binding sensor domain-containing protein